MFAYANWLKTFLKATSVPIGINFEWKTQLFGKIFQEAPKNSFSACFMADIFVKKIFL